MMTTTTTMLQQQRPEFARGNSLASFSVNNGAHHAGAFGVEGEDNDGKAPAEVARRKRRVRFCDDEENNDGSTTTASVTITARIASPLDDLDDYDSLDEVRKRCFYSKDDLNRFEKDRALTAMEYVLKRERGYPWNEDDGSNVPNESTKNNNSNNRNQHTIRGLETLLRANDPKYQSPDRRRRHAAAVLVRYQKLRRQLQKEVEDDEDEEQGRPSRYAAAAAVAEALAEASRKSSSESSKDAIAVAKEDAAYVFNANKTGGMFGGNRRLLMMKNAFWNNSARRLFNKSSSL